MGAPTLYKLIANEVQEITVAGVSGTMTNNTAKSGILITQALSKPTATQIRGMARLNLSPEDDRYYESVGGAYKFYACALNDCDLSVFPKG